MSFWSKARETLNRFQQRSEDGNMCRHGNVPHQPGTPEFEMFIARKEMETGNLEHGARHLAELLSYEPTSQEALAVLDEYLSRVGGDVSRLYPLRDQRYFAEEAVRAFVWARKGDLSEALDLLFQVAQAKPSSTYWDDWALPWLERLGSFAAIPVPTTERCFSLALTRFPENRFLIETDREKLERYVALARRVPLEVQSSVNFQMIHAGLLRKLGQFADSIQVACDTSFHPRGWHSYVAEGLALREQGDFESAASAFGQALQYDPEDLSARLEAADGYLNHGVWEKALFWYGQVLHRQPEHSWALPSALFCRWKSAGNTLKRDRLIQLARSQTPNQRAVQLLRLREPYVGILPPPKDALANALRNITKSFRETPPEDAGSLTITLSHIESPSATLALQEQLKALGNALKVLITVKSIPFPDPRVPCCPVAFPIWSYDGTDARVCVASPSPVIQRRVAGLAADPFDRDENFADAGSIARELCEEHIPQLLATMVYPPPIPPTHDALEWIPRVQLSSAQIIAQIGSGWIGSPRRNALLSALFGPRDWVTVAAIITLAQLAEHDVRIAADVNVAFQALSEVIPDGGYCCFTHALFACWQWLPTLTPEEKRSLYERCRMLDEE